MTEYKTGVQSLAPLTAEIRCRVVSQKGRPQCHAVLKDNGSDEAQKILDFLFPNGVLNIFAVGLVNCCECPGFQICEEMAKEQIRKETEPHQGFFSNS